MRFYRNIEFYIQEYFKLPSAFIIVKYCMGTMEMRFYRNLEFYIQELYFKLLSAFIIGEYCTGIMEMRFHRKIPQISIDKKNTMLPTRKSMLRSSKQFDHTKIS